MKPEKPITRKEMYLDVATGGSTELPSPVTREEKYLAKIAGESVDIPTPVTRYEMLLAAVAGESYTLTPVTRLEIYLSKAAGQDVETPQPVTREEMYWFDYCGGTPTPPEREYTGAVPVTFVADGTPLLDYIISGNTAQSGTPTPDNPIMPQGTGDKTANLFDYNAYFDSVFTPYNVFFNYAEIQLQPNTTYTLSTSIEEIGGNPRNTAFIVATSNETPTTASGGISNVSPITKTTESDGILKLYKRISGSGVLPTKGLFDAGDWLMLNTGTTPLPYGYKIPISSANTTTPVYLGEVESTRKIRKLVLTGEETITKAASNPVFTIQLGGSNTPLSENAVTTLSTHYQSQNNATGTGNVGDMKVCIRRGYGTMYIGDTRYDNATDFKSYLAQQYANGTPVTIWYVLSTEQTGIVNEPLMKIGDYADTLSMEQAGAQIPTANGSNTLDVETTVKPSEVYIKYRGEAVATLSTLSAEVSSPEETPEEVNPEETEETENGSEDVSL